MTTQFFGFGNGRFGHPEQDRAISLREGAILQIFPPPDYEFTRPEEQVCQKSIGRLIGNAVPVQLGMVRIGIGTAAVVRIEVDREYAGRVRGSAEPRPRPSSAE